MYALRERRVHVTQEDFEMAVAKVSDITSCPKYIAVPIRSVLLSFSHKHFFPSTDTVLLCAPHQVMQKDSEKNMSIKKLWK